MNLGGIKRLDGLLLVKRSKRVVPSLPGGRGEQLPRAVSGGTGSNGGSLHYGGSEVAKGYALGGVYAFWHLKQQAFR